MCSDLYSREQGIRASFLGEVHVLSHLQLKPQVLPACPSCAACASLTSESTAASPRGGEAHGRGRAVH